MSESKRVAVALFLLVMTLPHCNSEASPFAPEISHTYHSACSSETYTFQGVIENNSILTGDHILVNFTVESTPLETEVEKMVLEVWTQDALLIDIVSDSKSIIFDTYNLCQNMTVDFRLNVTLNVGLSYSYLFQNVTCNNFFAPKVRLVSPNGGEDWSSGLHNITWTSSDRNTDDEILFQLRFSLDGGAYWQILAFGRFPFDVSEGYYFHTLDFDTIFATTKGIVEVTGFDNDTMHAGGPHPIDHELLLPSFWPFLSSNDSSDAVLTMGSAAIGPGPTFSDSVEISVGSPEDVELFEGQTEQVLSWTIEHDNSILISVFRNGSLLKESSVWGYGTQTIRVSLDGLAIGIHVFEIHVIPVDARLSGEARDVVIVTVEPLAITVTTELQYPSPIIFVLMGAAGSVTGFAIVVALAIIRSGMKESKFDDALES